jgi:hypothetical protein
MEFQTMEDRKVTEEKVMRIGQRLARARVLEVFFREVAELTLNHDVLNGNAVVYPRKLEESLKKVEPEWWKQLE